jgi:hypothetical protein
MMFRWALEAQTHAKANPKEVWDAWTEVSSWPIWNTCIKASSLEGEFRSGAAGKSKPFGGFASPFTILSAEQGKRFTSKTRFFGTKIVYSHYVAPWWDEKVRIVQRVEASGFFAPFLWFFLGRKWKKRLPESMKNFTTFIENRK